MRGNPVDDASARALQVRRGIWLEYFTIVYNSLRAVIALLAGIVAGSIALARAAPIRV